MLLTGELTFYESSSSTQKKTILILNKLFFTCFNWTLFYNGILISRFYFYRQICYFKLINNKLSNIFMQLKKKFNIKIQKTKHSTICWGL